MDWYHDYLYLTYNYDQCVVKCVMTIYLTHSSQLVKSIALSS